MKKLSIALCILMVAVFLFTLVGCDRPQEPDTLVVYNWADYIYDYEDDFKAYYKGITGKDIEITYVTFDTNETMLTKITKGDSNVDVVCPSEYAIQKLIEMDYLIPLNYFDESKYTKGMTTTGYVHNADNVDKNIVDKIQQTFGDIGGKNMLDYMVPYMYGTLGVLYNKYQFMELGIYDKDIMNQANWGLLFNDNGKGQLLHEELTGQILMKDSIRDTYAVTLFYLLERGKLNGLRDVDGNLYTNLSANQLINSVDDNLLDVVKQTLTQQKQQLFGYEVDFGKDDLLKGNAMVDLAWSGDALYAVEESWNDNLGEEGDYELSYYVPHGAGNIWFDGWVIPKTYNPAHEEAIKLFINFLNSPTSAAANMMEIGYSSAVAPDKILADNDAKSILAEVYCVNAPEYLDKATLDAIEADNGFDYDCWDDFEEEFFFYCDEIDGTNWRYPLESDFANADGRDTSTFGVMRDFGAKNKDVVTMWNYVRSAGVNALPMFLWMVLAVAVVVGGAYFVHFLVERSRFKQIVNNKKQ
ncbi:MAG: extracellular solute-binding protein [Clostridia bacterium]|nr:extracellular solute-binding protein [Clostridia bacterium]